MPKIETPARSLETLYNEALATMRDLTYHLTATLAWGQDDPELGTWKEQSTKAADAVTGATGVVRYLARREGRLEQANEEIEAAHRSADRRVFGE